MSSSERQRHSAAMLIWTGVIVTTTVLFSRRIAGEFSLSSAWPAIFVSSASSILSLTAWGLFHRDRTSMSEPRRDRMVAFVAWLPTWLSGLAVAPVTSPLAQGWLIGIALISGGLFALFGQWHVEAVAPVSGKALADGQQQQVSLATPAASALPLNKNAKESISSGSQFLAESSSSFAVFDPLTEDDEESEESTDALVTQRMTRQTLPDGVEEIEGSVRVQFAAGQRIVSVHVPFSPPFAVAPQVECELVSDEEVRSKVSVVYPYGIRIELKRSRSDSEAEVELCYSAICEQPQSDAA